MKKIKKLIVIALATTMLLGSTLNVNASELNPMVNLTSDNSLRASTIYFDSFTLNNGQTARTNTFAIHAGTTFVISLRTDHLSSIEIMCRDVDTGIQIGNTGVWTTNGGTWTFTVQNTGNYQFYFKNWEAGPVTFNNVTLTF